MDELDVYLQLIDSWAQRRIGGNRLANTPSQRWPVPGS
jgi:hypothetical protein